MGFHQLGAVKAAGVQWAVAWLLATLPALLMPWYCLVTRARAIKLDRAWVAIPGQTSRGLCVLSLGGRWQG